MTCYNLSMHSNLASVIMRFLLSFLVLQAVTLAGCVYIYRPLKNRRAWRWALAYLLSLNSAYFFLFAPTSMPLWLWTGLEYLLLIPFFIYSLICMLLAPVFVAAGALFLFYKMISRLKPSPGPDRKPTDGAGPRFDSGRRTCMKALASGIIYPVAASSAYGAYIGKEQPPNGAST